MLSAATGDITARIEHPRETIMRKPRSEGPSRPSAARVPGTAALA